MTETTSTAANLEALREVREDILRLARHRKAANVRVFGSFATMAANEASDVDFLVTMEADATLVDLIGLEQDLEALLGRAVDVITDDAVDPRMQDEVYATAIRL